MKRYHDEDIVFYLTEVIDGKEEVLIDSVQYKSIDNAKIWVENVSANTDNNIKHTYRLRAWISDSVVISDTASYADYTTTEWNDSYVSLQVRVTGDFVEKKGL